MGKKREEARGKREEAKGKPIFGSGAEPQPEPKDDGLVRCVCTVACAWNGYHDEGDKVFVKRELMEGDPFFRAHFKAVEPLPEGQRRQDGDEGGEGDTQSQETEHDDNAGGEGENAAGEGETAAGEGETAAEKNGQGELGLN